MEESELRYYHNLLIQGETEHLQQELYDLDAVGVKQLVCQPVDTYTLQEHAARYNCPDIFDYLIPVMQLAGEDHIDSFTLFKSLSHSQGFRSLRSYLKAGFHNYYDAGTGQDVFDFAAAISPLRKALLVSSYPTIGAGTLFSLIMGDQVVKFGKELNKVKAPPLNITGASGCDLLTYACYWGSHKIAELLLETKAFTTKGSVFDHYSYLYAAALGGEVQCLNLFLHKSYYGKNFTKSGITLGSCAALSGDYDCLVASVEFEESIKASPLKKTCLQGKTVLHYAAGEQSVKNVIYLINKGCDINTYDASGRTPAYYAYLKRRLDILAVFAQKGAICEQKGATDDEIEMGIRKAQYTIDISKHAKRDV